MVLTDKRSRAAELRREVFERDHAVCALCGVNVNHLKEMMYPNGAQASDFFDALEQFADGRMPEKDDAARDYINRFLAVAQRIAQDMDALLWNRPVLRNANPWLSKVKRDDQWWHADHIIPLCEGGKNELANLRTLCVGCHKQVTKELKQRLARMPAKNRGVRPIK